MEGLVNLRKQNVLGTVMTVALPGPAGVLAQEDSGPVNTWRYGRAMAGTGIVRAT